MEPKHPDEPCEPPPGWIADERNRYFTGKIMTARDFADEQAYHISRQRLHTRLFHGWGIVCGLEVEPHPNPDCRPQWVLLRKGIAIDCYGRELIVPKDIPVRLPRTREDPPASGSGEEEVQPPYFLCLKYDLEKTEYVPALYAEETCDPYRTDASRVREGACRVFLPDGELPPGCWKAEADPEAGPDASGDCAADPCGPTGCLEPVCPCGEVVPLALIDPGETNTDGSEPKIDLGGRHYLFVKPRKALTHLVYTNWKHGHTYSLAHLRHRMRGRLRLRFDRRIRQADDSGHGVGRDTLVVQYLDDGVLKRLPHRRGFPPYLAGPDEDWAVFRIDPRFLRHRGGLGHRLLGSTIVVTLKCNFILDCHGNAVDGDHLRGRLPSGDDVEGGTFESWFQILDDCEDEGSARGADEAEIAENEGYEPESEGEPGEGEPDAGDEPGERGE